MTLYDEIRGQWQHCLRCSLHAKRCEVDRAAGKAYAEVAMSDALRDPPEGEPYLLHILLPCPDPQQFLTGSLRADVAGETSSPVWGLLDAATFGGLADHLPPGTTAAVSTALGCRPINHDNPRALVEPKSQWVKACRPRLQAELALRDAYLVVACGKHAVASLRPDLTKSWRDHLGGVIPFQVPAPWDPGRLVTRCAFVTHSPEDVVLNEPRPPHGWRLDEWQGKPAGSFVSEPYFTWLWHLFCAAWLADTVRACGQNSTRMDISFWPHVVASLEEHFQSVAESGNTEDLAARIRDEVMREQQGPGARFLQRHAEVSDEEEDETVDVSIEDLDDGEEDDDDSE